MAKLTSTKITELLNLGGVHPDSVHTSKGAFVAKRAYFYRHGMTPEKIAESIVKALNKSGLQVTILEANDEWRNWPKTSYFVVKFKVS